MTMVQENVRTGRKRGQDAGDDRVSLEGLYRRPGYLIRRAHQINTALFSRFSEGGTTTQFGVLWIVYCLGEVDQATLTRHLSLDKTNVGMVVRVLQRKGWIDRVRSRVDRRQWRISLTASGAAALRTMQQAGDEAQRQFFTSLTDEEERTLTRLLSKLVLDRERSSRPPGSDIPADERRGPPSS